MPPLLDIVLVTFVVLAAGGYLIRRKARSLKSIQRDWATGHAEVCNHCPAIKIRQAQAKAPASRQ